MNEPELAESGGTPSGADPKARDRRVVTVLFADIVGSTALIEGADAEAAMNLLTPAVALMVDAVRRFGGTVNHRAGDGIMAVFGVPAMQEDHARRACHAALALQQALGAHGAQLKAANAVALQVRVGLSSGRVLAAGIEDATGRVITYEATGAVVHLANRVQSGAAPGAVNVAESTYQLARDRFDFRPLGAKVLKGFAQPQPIYHLLRAKGKATAAAGPSGPAPASGHARTPLVGRQDEIAVIGRVFARLSETGTGKTGTAKTGTTKTGTTKTGTGGLLLVTGDAGIGKTRLLDEMRALLPRSVLCLEGHALSFGQRLSYWPFIEMLRPLLGVADGAGEDAVWDAIEREIGRLFPAEADEILPYVATLLGI